MNNNNSLPYLPVEIQRLIISFARPLRPYIHELKYHFIYHKDEYEPQPTFVDSDDEEEDFNRKSLSRVPIYNKGFIKQIKTYGGWFFHNNEWQEEALNENHINQEAWNNEVASNYSYLADY